MKITLVLVFTLGLAVAKLDSADPVNLQDNNVNEKVEELLLKDKDKSDNFFDSTVKTFTTDYLMQHQLLLTTEEALGIVEKAKDKATEQNTNQFLPLLAKVFTAADKLKVKTMACKVTKGKPVHHFVEEDTLQKMKDKFISLAASWECPDKSQSVPNDLLSSGFDWKYVEMFKMMLRSDPKPLVNLVSQFCQSKGFLSKETMPIFTMVTNEFVNNKEYLEYAISFIDSFETFFKAESGKRLLQILPQLLSADTETALELFAREADYNQEAFFNLIKNGDMAGVFLKQVAKFFISMFKMAKEAMDDQLKFAIVNGMLISNDFPAVDKRNMLKSISGIIEKVLKLTTTIQFEDSLYKEVKVVTDEFEKLYFKFEEFEKLNEKELENVLSKFLNENVLEQLKDAWVANRHVTTVDDKCAEFLTCIYNEKHKNTNAIVRTVTKGASVFMAYSWSSLFGGDVDYWKVYQAIWNGQGDRKTCKEIYVATDAKKCDAFARLQQQVGMNLGYDHTEL